MHNTLPLLLYSEIRYTFRQCAHQHKRHSFKSLSFSQFRQFGNSRAIKSPRGRDAFSRNPRTSQTIEHEEAKSRTGLTTDNVSSSVYSQQSREVIPQKQGGKAVGTRRTVDAPMKIIPKADITPNLKLTPKERLHIEILTRRAPPVVKQIKPYKQKLLIYHHGNARENALIFGKVLSLVGAAAVTLIIVPANYAAGTSTWLCGLFFILGCSPALILHHIFKPLVTRIHLRLPLTARASPEAAMKFAHNLPASAELDISFTRITALPGTVTVNMADLQPIAQTSRWQFANLRWVGSSVDKGTRFRPNPTTFSVNPTVGPGRARRDVIPGIWANVYKRLMSVTQEQVSKWKK